jgi:hypothetical protein
VTCVQAALEYTHEVIAETYALLTRMAGVRRGTRRTVEDFLIGVSGLGSSPNSLPKPRRIAPNTA